ncbi:hypothetical protein BCR39DRAFT_526040 [Naematelia encephala]|uniref:Uncharacterized protein n=1 Tax=Naematelia encephala TaxID=71784 RepID=A0A1Y2B9T3_9TREE|nr:hypothetical protein BCR39DRAFT_526040 [Naematelia encephala]
MVDEFESESLPLLDYLCRPGLLPEQVSGALEEFALRSLLSGTRVRQWCDQVTWVIDKLNNLDVIRACIRQSPLCVLFPFTRLPSSPYFTTSHPRLSSPILPLGSLSDITRKQLVDALVRLASFCSDYETTQELAFELCLEYIGRRWRGSVRSEDVVHGIGRKLAEAESELQLLGNATLVIPALQRIRFELGFVTSCQLAQLLDANSISSNHLFDPYQLVSAWLVRRLSLGIAPQTLVDELVGCRDKLTNTVHQATLTTVLADFGLLGRSRSMLENSVLSQFGVIPAMPCTPKSTHGRRRNKTTSFLTKSVPRRTMPCAPRWWVHRRNNSSSIKIQSPPFNADRRPSLPSMSTPLSVSISAFSSPQSPATTSSPSRSDVSTPPESSSTTFRLNVSPSESELLSSMMAFSNPEDMRLILLDHLLSVRYGLKYDAQDDWFLGTGRRVVEETMASLETKLVGRKDVMGLKGIFTDLRDIFHLVRAPPIPLQPAFRRRQHLLDNFPDVPPRDIASPFSFRERDESFDLDQYIADISFSYPLTDTKEMNEDEVPDFSQPHDSTPEVELLRRGSAGAESMLSMTSGSKSTRRTSLLSDHTLQRASLLSDYTIREAHVASVTGARPVAYLFPRRPHSVELLDELDDPVGSDKRWAGSTTDIPAFSSQRRGAIYDLSALYPHAEDMEIPPPTTQSSLEVKAVTATEPFTSAMNESLLSTDDPRVQSCTPPDDRTRRQTHRRYAVPVSPESSPEANVPSTPSPPLTSSSQDEPPPPPPPPNPKSSLEIVFGLFERRDSGDMVPRRNLSMTDVEVALRDVLIYEQTDKWDERSEIRVKWLFTQVATLLDGSEYSQVVENVIRQSDELSTGQTRDSDSFHLLTPQLLPDSGSTHSSITSVRSRSDKRKDRLSVDTFGHRDSFLTIHHP